MTSDLALLDSKTLMVDYIAKRSENKITVYDNLNVLGTLTVAGNVQTGGTTSSNMTFIGTTQVDILNALTKISTNTIKARNTSHLLVDDNLTVNGDLVVQGSNIKTAIDGISTQLALKAPSAPPTFTGTLNADLINITSGGLGEVMFRHPS